MTWSIIARDPATGAFGVAVASYVPNVGKAVPFVAQGIGAVATQGAVNRAYGPRALQLLEAGNSPQDAIRDLTSRDTWEAERQVHAIDVRGRVSAFTGSKCHDWSGHLSTTNASVAGNMLASRSVIAATIKAYENAASLPFSDRLIAALEAGEKEGGDMRGTRSAALLISSSDGSDGTRIEVENSRHPIVDLRRQHQARNTGMMDFLIPANETPEEAELRKKKMVVDALRGPQAMPQNVGQGLAVFGDALADRYSQYKQQGKAFPAAPEGSADPSFGTGFMNFLTGRKNGGLF
ncbi:putative Ntn-hydrolase superfamily protein [Rhizobium sp. PP-F2F-G38]|nr:putative Ntn-hydrolase superfamily protein [Rhizobium sp. PP-F2F-G38]